MTNSHMNYEELIREKKELETLLQFQRAQIRQDITGLKDELRPARQVMSLLGKLFTKDKTSPLITGGASMLIDLVVRKFILGRAGWITKLVVPFFLKNYSSHILSEKRPGIWKKLVSLFSRNGTSHHEKPGMDMRNERLSEN